MEDQLVSQIYLLSPRSLHLPRGGWTVHRRREVPPLRSAGGSLQQQEPQVRSGGQLGTKNTSDGQVEEIRGRHHGAGADLQQLDGHPPGPEVLRPAGLLRPSVHGHGTPEWRHPGVRVAAPHSRGWPAGPDLGGEAGWDWLGDPQ